MTNNEDDWGSSFIVAGCGLVLFGLALIDWGKFLNNLQTGLASLNRG